jgi:hypothetical protein
MLSLSGHTSFLRCARIRRGRSLAVGLSTVLLSLGAVACGGSGSKSNSTKAQTTPASATPPATTSPSQGGGKSSVSTGPVHGTLRGANQAPRINRDWSYAISVTDAGGHPLSGTVDIEFAFGGQVVGGDTPPTHPVTNGRSYDKLKFPAAAVGMPLTFQAVVHTRLGSITLDWPVTVRR